MDKVAGGRRQKECLTGEPDAFSSSDLVLSVEGLTSCPLQANCKSAVSRVQALSQKETLSRHGLIALLRGSYEADYGKVRG